MGSDKLTIITPLYGRPAFTLRYLLYLEAIHCPYRVYLIDGSLDDQNKVLLKTHRHRFQHIRYEYHRYPPGRDGWKSLFKNIEDILRKITTPYVVRWDVDDFRDLTAMGCCIEALDQDGHCAYVGCMGQMIWFTTRNNEAFADMMEVYPVGLDRKRENDQVQERLLTVDAEGVQVVYRREPMRMWCARAVGCRFDFPFVEKFLFLCGKIKLLSLTYLYKQTNSLTYTRSFVLEKCFNPDYANELHQSMDLITKKLGVCKDQQCALSQKILLTYFGLNDAKTFREWWNLNAQLQSTFWKKLVSFYSRFNRVRRFPQTLKHFYLNDKQTLSMIKKVLKESV